MQTCRMIVLTALLAIATACARQEPVSQSTSPDEPASTRPATARIVNIYNWSDYIDPDVLAEFEKSTGIKVNYDTFDSQEMMETKVLTGRTGYDVVTVSASTLERLAPTGAIRKLDRSRLPGLGNLDPEMTAELAKFDPGNEHAVGYFWGTTGIAVDESKLSELAPDAPVGSLKMIFDPKVVAKFAGCGVSIVDAPSEVIGTALIASGKGANDVSPESLAAAQRALLAIRRYVRKVDGNSQIGDLSGGSICLMLTWGTNVVLARARAREAGVNADFRYVIPEEGAVSWFDTLAIPTDAPHPDEAYAFLEFMLRPDIAARNANYVGNATMNAAAVGKLDATLRDDASLYPPPDVRARLQPLRGRTQAESRDESRIWTRFLTGQ